MKIKNPMLVVTDIDKSVEFYKKVLGLHVITDFGANKTLTGGLSLQTLESWQEPVILNILSAAKAPKYDGKGNKTGNIMTGHILYREAEMTFSRKAFLKIFENKEFTQLVYR